MSALRTTLLLTLTTPLLAQSAQSCPGTTYSSICCIGTIVGSSVALPPASSFPLGTPPGGVIPTASPTPGDDTPTNWFVDPTRPPTGLPTNTLGSSIDAAALSSMIATDTNVFSILPVSGVGKRQDGRPSESILAKGVTCRGRVTPLASGSGGSASASASASASVSGEMTTGGGGNAGSSTGTAPASSSAEPTSASGSASGTSSEAAGNTNNASQAAAPAATVGLGQKVGAACAAGLGVLMAAL